MAKTKTMRRPGKEYPAASQSRIQWPPTTEPHHRNTGKNTKPSVVRPESQTAVGLDRRFLRTQPRVLGPGSLRKAQSRRSEYCPNTQPPRLNINASLGVLHVPPSQGETITSSANPYGRF